MRNRITNPKKRRAIERVIGGPALWVTTNGGLAHRIEAVRNDGAEWVVDCVKGVYYGAPTGVVWTPQPDGFWTRHIP